MPAAARPSGTISITLPTRTLGTLADQISTFLSYAPTPRYDEAATAQLLDEPSVQSAATAVEAEGSACGPSLRGFECGLDSPRASGGGGSRGAGLGDEGRDKAARHPDAMECGELDATTVSDRLLAVLSRLLRMNPADLVRTGMPGAGPAPAGACSNVSPATAKTREAPLDLRRRSRDPRARPRVGRSDESFGRD
jgi:hypothetical protein